MHRYLKDDEINNISPYNNLILALLVTKIIKFKVEGWSNYSRECTECV